MLWADPPVDCRHAAGGLRDEHSGLLSVLSAPDVGEVAELRQDSANSDSTSGMAFRSLSHTHTHQRTHTPTHARTHFPLAPISIHKQQSTAWVQHWTRRKEMKPCFCPSCYLVMCSQVLSHFCLQPVIANCYNKLRVFVRAARVWTCFVYCFVSLSCHWWWWWAKTCKHSSCSSVWYLPPEDFLKVFLFSPSAK